MFNERARVDLLFLGDIIALHAMGMFSKYPLPLPEQSKSPQEVRDVFCGGCQGIFGWPGSIHSDEEGAWTDEIWTNLYADRRINYSFKEKEPIHGYWNDEVALYVELKTVSLMMTGHGADGSFQKRSGV